MFPTRQTTLDFMKNKMDARPQCKYGSKCYQKNPDHKKKFRHPPDLQSDQVQVKRKAEPALPDKDLDATTASSVPKKAKCDDDGSSSKNCNSSELDTSQALENFFCDAEEELPPDPSTLEESIKQKFLVEMPDDFYKFWQYCRDLNEDDPLEALSAVGLRLVGAYDVMAGRDLRPRCLSRYLCHWRYYHDPPEMQTVLSCSNDGYHIGYFRDDPAEAPVFLASMSDLKPGTVSPMADNIFDAVRTYCVEAGKKADPFKKLAFSKMAEQLETAAKKFGFALDSKTDAVKRRKKKVVCKSFHGAGIVVPFDKETEVGYREVPETDAGLRRMLQQVVEAKTDEGRKAVFSHVQELVTNAQWATDEGDFGMGLELGMDLFIFGCPYLHSSALHLMTVAYDLLDRGAFSTILKAHLKNRREGHELSAFKSPQR